MSPWDIGCPVKGSSGGSKVSVFKEGQLEFLSNVEGYTLLQT